MTQAGYAIKKTAKYEDFSSLKKNMAVYNTVIEHTREIPQTTTDALANLEELGGETLTAMSASKVLEVWQKTDQVGTDGGATGKVTWANVDGTKTDATFTLNAVATTTHAPLVAAVTTARNVESFSLDTIDCADEVIIGNVAGTEIFGTIKIGQHQLIKSRYMATASRRTFIGKINANLTLSTAAVYLIATFIPVGETLAVTQTWSFNEAKMLKWEPCIEVEAGTEVSWTIDDDNVAHPVAHISVTYLEVYNA